MILICNHFSQKFDFDELQNGLLVIENSNQYYQIVKELFEEFENGIDSSFLLSERGETLSLSKNALFLYDFINFQPNNKKVLNELSSQILTLVKNNDFVENFSKINENIIKINDEILSNFDFKIDYEDDFDAEKFIKFSNYRISVEGGLCEKICAYIKIYASLKKTKLVIFVGLMQFVSKDELEMIIKQVNYLDLDCLFIEPQLKYSLTNIKRIIIDKDLCEI